MRDRHVVGSLLREARLGARMRQSRLAELAEITQPHLCRIEGDYSYCSDVLALTFSDILGVPVEAFTRPGPHPNHENVKACRKRAAA